MARELDTLPGSKIQENLPARFLNLLLDNLDFLLKADAKRMFLRMRAEVFELGLQFEDGLFEVEPVFHTWWRIRVCGRQSILNPLSVRIEILLRPVDNHK